MKLKTGWVACDYTRGDMLTEVPHGRIHLNAERAVEDRRSQGYEGVRYVSCDGFLYVDPPNEEDN